MKHQCTNSAVSNVDRMNLDMEYKLFMVLVEVHHERESIIAVLYSR